MRYFFHMGLVALVSVAVAVAVAVVMEVAAVVEVAVVVMAVLVVDGGDRGNNARVRIKSCIDPQISTTKQ